MKGITPALPATMHSTFYTTITTFHLHSYEALKQTVMEKVRFF